MSMSAPDEQDAASLKTQITELLSRFKATTGQQFNLDVPGPSASTVSTLSSSSSSSSSSSASPSRVASHSLNLTPSLSGEAAMPYEELQVP